MSHPTQRQNGICASPAGSEAAHDGDPRPQTSREKVSHPCVSLTRTSQQTHHAVMLPTLFLFPRTSLSLVTSPDVSHLEQGARSTTACMCSA